MTTLTLDRLARDIEEFLEFKHGLGSPYRRGEAALRSFQRFAHEHAAMRSVELEPTLRAWLSRREGRKAVSAANELGALRQLCLYRRRRDPSGFVPEHAWAPQTESVHFPHIFSAEQIRRLLDTAGRHRGRNIWGGMLRTLLVVLYCTGLRFGEAVRLRLSDVDVERCTFLIRESKGRTRLVPFGADLAGELRTYLQERAMVAQASGLTSVEALFIRKSGDALPLGAASQAVRQLLRRVGLKPARGRTGPRPYDFRHTFAVHRLTEWYRAELDIHARLPLLSAYMGHVNVLGTEVYLHATSELLQLAGERFERRVNLPGTAQ